MSDDCLILEERFEEAVLSDEWWVEGGESVRIENGYLRIRSDPKKKGAPGYVCTVWNKQILRGDVQVDFDAHVLGSTLNANNINCFLFYSDPTGESLFDTRHQRADGEYAHYHQLNGYIFTFVSAGLTTPGDQRARIRMRRCPGFELMSETFDYHSRQNVTYHVTIRRQEGKLSLAIDGHVFLEKHDPEPWREGLFGLRTYHTDLRIDNLVIQRPGEGITKRPGDDDAAPSPPPRPTLPR